MNELLPYEIQIADKLAVISLPGEDASWNAMRKMLEEDDDNDVIVPPLARGCFSWISVAVLALLLITAGVIAYRVSRSNKSASPVTTMPQPRDSITSKNGTGSTQETAPNKDNQTTTPPSGKTKTIQKQTDGKIILGDSITKVQTNFVMVHRLAKKGTSITNTVVPGIGTSPLYTVNTTNAGIGQKNKMLRKTDTTIVNSTDDILKAVSVSGGRQSKSNNTNQPLDDAQPKALPVITHPSGDNSSTNNKFSSKVDVEQPESIAPPKSNTAKKDSTKTPVAKDNEDDNKIWFGAGLGLQQLIPIDGQKTSPYNAFGRKGSLADYIPSAYFRVYKKKEFFQIEFRYGAPQYTKNLEYRNKVIDTTGGIKTFAVSHVQKTYYTELPVSIHYTAIPNLSIGVGAIWNKFQSAIVQQQIEKNDGPGGRDSVISNNIANTKTDSAFAKSYFQFMFELQYTWRRFSLGARYSQGLQPYITYTSPVTGETERQKNSSLQIFLKYELWRSKKKNNSQDE